MRLKTSASLLAAVAVAMSMGTATAATLVVDDFSQLGTPPASPSQNAWNVTGLTNVHGGTREQNKSGGSSSTYSIAGGHLRMSTTSTGAGNNWDLFYDGVAAPPASAGSFTSFANPNPGPINAQGFTWLNVLMPQVAPGGNGTTATNRPAIIATLKWSATATGSVQTSTRELKLTDYKAGGFSFKLSDFAPTIGPAATPGKFIRGVKIRVQGLVRKDATTPGVTEFDRLFFATSSLPEPGTFALAAMGLVGLVVARRKMR